MPRGTQVVLRRDLRAALGARDSEGRPAFKKKGSVGEVAEAPITNDYHYVVRFADGLVVHAKKADLAVRRSDAPELALGERDPAAYEPHVIYRVCIGSRAFGLADEESDVDERGVFLPPAEWGWSLQPLPTEIEFQREGPAPRIEDGAASDASGGAVCDVRDGTVSDVGDAPVVAVGEGSASGVGDGAVLDVDDRARRWDVCWWEIGKFLRFALKANPNILEMLYAPDHLVIFANEWGRRLRELRPAFLSKYLYRTYSGYVLSQFRLMRRDRERGKQHKAKHAMHLIRLLHSGIDALEGRGIRVDVAEHRAELLRIKAGEVPLEEVYAMALELDRRFQDARAHTALPERPDVAAVDRFLVEARRSSVGAGGPP